MSMPNFFLVLATTDAQTAQSATGEPSPWLVLVPIVMGIVSLVLLFAAAKALWRKRLIQNIPTSKCEGITIGLNELKGEAVSRVPMRSYLTQKDVVYYCYKIEEEVEREETYKDKDGKTKTRTKRVWETVRSDERRPRFTLRDDTGSVRVDPAKAEIRATTVLSKVCRRNDPLYHKGPHFPRPKSTGRRRFTEEVIENGQELYLLGNARVREDIVAPEIAYEKTAEIFLISTVGEKKLVSSYAWRSRISFLFALLFGAAAPFFFFLVAQDLTAEVAFDRGIVWMILAAVLVSMFFFGLYLKTIYNGLVDVRNRSRRAWSMLEVELKRRHDLIPNLVSIVRSVAEHELETLAATTQARAGVQVPKEPSEQGVEQVNAMVNQQSQTYSQIFAVVERYPNLQAEASFHRLMKELVRCEDKIALARTFYNDSVERLNNRVEGFPDMIFASVAKASPALLISADEFEKKPVRIQLTEEPEPEPEPEAELQAEAHGDEHGDEHGETPAQP